MAELIKMIGGMGVVIVLFLLFIVVPSAVKIVREYERGVIFRLGRLVGARGPGLFFIIPIVEQMIKVDLRVVTMDVAKQETMTRDNVPVTVDAVIYFQVVNPDFAVTKVENFVKATSLISQTTLRSIVGQVELDSLLAERDVVNQKLQTVIDEQTEPWGVKVNTVEVRDVVLPEGMRYDEVKAFFVKHFKEMAQEAAGYGFEVVWEFEPGFIINEPANVAALTEAVGEPNFSLLFDTCHAHNCSLGLRHVEKGMALPGGIMEFIGMCKNKIGLVHLIDSDGTLNDTGTSTHAPFGQGHIDFDQVILALLEVAGYKGEWWAIDLCEWPNAWEVAEDCYKFVSRLNRKYCR